MGILISVSREYLKQKLLAVFAVLIILFLFIFLRWNNITETLFFQNDMGRDFLTLYTWQESGKPPLLGPQNSVLPFNQSAIYFYLFFPLFVLSNHSLYTTNLMLSLMFVCAFCFGCYALRKQKQALFVLLITACVFSVHPQAVLQNRYIWNPSFVPLFLIASYFFFTKLQTSFSKQSLAAFSLAAGLATGMSLSALPAVIAYVMLGIIIFRRNPKKILWLVTGLVLGHVIVFLPYLVFEMRYDFRILSRVLAQGSTMASASTTSTMQRAFEVLHLVLPAIKYNWLLFLFVMGFAIKLGLKNKDLRTNQTSQLAILFLITTSLILLSPIHIEAHYIFGPLAFLILLIASFPQKAAVAVTFMLLFFWLRPVVVSQYFSPAPRTISFLEKCLADFCSHHSAPMYVSVQANFHNYHFGPEFRYLMAEKGCHIKNIESGQNEATEMAVISDGGKYVHGTDQFEELSLFGSADETEVVSCSETFKIHVLDRK